MENKIDHVRFVQECQLLSQARDGGLFIRMGQFFCIKFPWLDEVEPDLFYMTDSKKASDIIKKYVV